MEQQAAHPGADAVVGVDIDDETVGDKMLMVSASGMAAKLRGPGPGVAACDERRHRHSTGPSETQGERTGWTTDPR
jgi:hypothetical protein